MRRFGKLSAGLFAAMFLMNGATAWAGDLADTVYYGGKIYTMQEYTINEETKRPDKLADDVQPVMAEVVATKDGKIIFVGTKADAEAAGLFDAKAVDKIVDLKGKTMYPGFIDGHGHFPQQGQNDLYNVNLNSPLIDGTIDSIDKLVKACADRAAATEKGLLIAGSNYDDTMMVDMRHPTAADLDKASTEHPIVVTHISGHVKAVNTYCLKASGLIDDAGNPTDLALNTNGVEIKDGKVTGVLFETLAMGTVGSFPSVPQSNLDTLTRCAQVYAAAGVTCVNNGAAVGLNALPGYWEAMQAGGMNVRVLVHPMGYYAADAGGGFIIDGIGWQGRAQLGWKQVPADMQMMNCYSDGTDGVPMGTDITSYPVGTYSMMGTDGPSAVQEAPEGLPENRILLGAWKIIFDGSPQAYTAWMKAPGNYYLGDYTEADEDRTATKGFEAYKGFNGLPGTLNMTVQNLTDAIAMYHKYGDSTETHTNGSGAAEAWVTAVENAVQLYPDVKDTRTTSIHGQTLERQHVERMAGKYDALASTSTMYTDLMGAGGKTLSEVGNLPELMEQNNLYINFFNNHVYFYGDRHHDIFFGPGRALNISPTGWAEAYGVPYTFHNDTFVTPISPLRSVTTAVTRLTANGKLLSVDGVKDLDAKHVLDARKYADGTTGEPMLYYQYDHRISALKALHAVTIGAAYQNKIDDRLGSIAEGKLADFVIMDKDVIQQAEDEATAIVKMRVATTIVDDQVIYGVLPDADTFAFSPVKAYLQPTGNEANVTAADVLAKEDVQVKEGAVLGAVAMNADVKAGEAAVFSFNFLGNGMDISDLKLVKIKNGEEFNFTLGRPADLNAGAEAIDGYWWISDFTDPLNEVKEGVLEENHMYTASFIIMDNGDFDASDENGKIVDPVAVVSISGTTPDNGQAVTDEANKQPEEPEAKPEDNKSGGSDGGCTVGTNPAYELFALLLASLGVMAGRIFRRRENA